MNSIEQEGNSDEEEYQIEVFDYEKFKVLKENVPTKNPVEKIESKIKGKSENPKIPEEKAHTRGKSDYPRMITANAIYPETSFLSKFPFPKDKRTPIKNKLNELFNLKRNNFSTESSEIFGGNLRNERILSARVLSPNSRIIQSNFPLQYPGMQRSFTNNLRSYHKPPISFVNGSFLERKRGFGLN